MQARKLRYAITCAIVGTVGYVGYFLVFPETRLLKGVLMTLFFVAMGVIIQMMRTSKPQDPYFDQALKKILLGMVLAAIIIALLFFCGASWGLWQVPIVRV